MAGKVITPRQLAQQWQRLPNKFEVNVFNFERLVGNAAKKIFRDSFYLRRFNSAGTFSWQSRRNHKPHPILEETGALNYSQIQTCSNLVIGNMEETFVMQQYIMKEGKLPNQVLQHPILDKGNL